MVGDTEVGSNSSPAGRMPVTAEVRPPPPTARPPLAGHHEPLQSDDTGREILGSHTFLTERWIMSRAQVGHRAKKATMKELAAEA